LQKGFVPSNVILDASFLIDICSIDKKILSYYSKGFPEVIVLDVIFDEVNSLSVHDCTFNKIIIKDTDASILETAARAFNNKNSSLSFNDYVLFYYCMNNDLTLITNDKRLKSECDSKNIKTLWVYQSIIELYKKGIITKSIAEKIGKEIAGINKRIKEDILNDFLNKLK
jgi:rRNA-processing protein FCF1